MAVLDDAKHKGGFTLFGKNFGNYNQDIKFRVFYEKKKTLILKELTSFFYFFQSIIFLI